MEKQETPEKLMRRSMLGEKRQYAARRASLAVDRLIRARSDVDLIKAARWAELWGKFARLPAALRRNQSSFCKSD